MDKLIIHYSHWAGQPDVFIACDNSCDSPRWKQPLDRPKDTCQLDDGRFYTFDKNIVTCEECLIKYPKTK